jgi:hypothetical protein
LNIINIALSIANKIKLTDTFMDAMLRLIMMTIIFPPLLPSFIHVAVGVTKKKFGFALGKIMKENINNERTTNE